MNTFKDFSLSPDLLRSLDSLSFIKPTSIQTDVIPLLLDSKNIIAKAHTGSGKTGAFGIPIIENLDWMENQPQALIIAPNRELVLQIAQDLTLMGRYKRIKALPIYGRDSIKAQCLALKQKNHIVVATPGRLMDLIERGFITLDKLKYLILDEGDELLRPEFMKQLTSTFTLLPKNCCVSLFSATINDDIKSLQSFISNEFQFIDTSESIAPDIHESFYQVNEEDKFSFLRSTLNTLENSGGIIFVSTKGKTNKLHKKLNANGFSAALIHSELNQRDRIKNMNAFKDGTFTYLVATDLSARGIDVLGINLVINYDLPVDLSNYTHRIGRIGRNGVSGRAISFVSTEQESLIPKLESKLGRPCNWVTAPLKPVAVSSSTSSLIERTVKGSNTGSDITKLYINGGKRKNLRATDIVGAICSIHTLTPQDIGIIEIKENETYVEIMNNKFNVVLQGLRETTIKGRLFKVHKAK